MSISLRIAGLEDLDDLIRLGRQTFIETYKGVGNRPPGLEETYGRETFNSDKLTPLLKTLHDPKRPTFLLGNIDGVPAGFAKIEFGFPPECVPNRNSAHFSQVYILKEFQGHGLGLRFFEKRRALAMNQGFSGLWLGVWDQNIKAIAFHKKMGFRVVGSIAWKFKHEHIDYEDNDLVMYQNIRGR
jgi:ribosomal protein S18 acetylase RimI-like enzyme